MWALMRKAPSGLRSSLGLLVRLAVLFANQEVADIALPSCG
jgi:hypothetical protein